MPEDEHKQYVLVMMMVMMMSLPMYCVHCHVSLKSVGIDAIARGKVAFLVMAGGQV